jgi:hypothetical protein
MLIADADAALMAMPPPPWAFPLLALMTDMGPAAGVRMCHSQ